MSSDVDLAPVKVGDMVEAYSLSGPRCGRVVAVHNDGTISLVDRHPGRYIDNEDGHFIQLGGVEPGETILMHCRARPERLADGTRRFLVMSPAEYQS